MVVLDVASLVVCFTGKVCDFLGFGLGLEIHDDVYPFRIQFILHLHSRVPFGKTS